MKTFFVYQEYFPYYLHADQNSSRFSIESRQPFLLKNIVDIGMNIPLKHK